MKKINLIFGGLFILAAITSCGNSGSSEATGDTSSPKSTGSDTGSGSMNNGATTTDNNSTSTAPMTNKMPLSAGDSTFVMKAAAGGMMEVQGGTTAQQNAASDRVKNYGAMMVADHNKANSELMAIASSKGLTPPSDLPADMKKHLDEMAKMKGKSFDSHYLSMMLNDHKKDIADFEKEANSGTDPDLKAFATKTLPVLKMHLDSVQAISKAKM